MEREVEPCPSAQGVKIGDFGDWIRHKNTPQEAAHTAYTRRRGHTIHGALCLYGLLVRENSSLQALSRE